MKYETISTKKNIALCSMFMLIAVTIIVKLNLFSKHLLCKNQCNTSETKQKGDCQKDQFKFDFSYIRTISSVHDQNVAVQNLMKRTVGEELSLKFNVTVIKNNVHSDIEAFHIYKNGTSLVQISGTSVSSAAAGFHHYLKHYLNCHISWDYNQLNIPNVFPDVDIQVRFPERFRLFSNVCTASYTYVWWDWSAWEREIDRWALTGINIAYASTGMEAVWTKVYRDLGLNDDEIDAHFSGPGFLAWNRMGNVRGWGGPLSKDWHSKQAVLQRRILARMRELGITPILPAFAGIVPVGFKRLFPDAKLSPLGKWCHFDEKYCCPLFLDPTDELFIKIGSKFLQEMKAQLGTDHMYSADSFNENLPPSGDLEYLSKASQGIYRAMSSLDSNATWVLQGWTFVNEIFFWTEDRVKAFLTGVPLGKILVLDLFAEQMPSHERLHSYFGQPYVWCMLHNFGGTLGMHGSLPLVNEGVSRARNQTGSLVGLGIVPEGLNQNYIVYDFMSDVFWSTETINMSNWVEQYTRRRYGLNTSSSSDVVATWQLLSTTLYSYNGSLGALHGRYKIVDRPSLLWKPETWYDHALLFKAWTFMLNSSRLVNSSRNYQYDVVDLTRQNLQVLFFLHFEELLTAFQGNDSTKLQAISEKMIHLLSDLEEVLASESKFLLGAWLKSAHSMASNTLESHLYEFNARNQITLWGPKGEIVDYATKQWSGIVSSYYLPRWTLFFSRLSNSLARKILFNQTEFNMAVLDRIEKPFSYNLNSYPSEPRGNSIEVAKRIHNTWLPLKIV